MSPAHRSPASNEARRLVTIIATLGGALIAAPGCSSDNSNASPSDDGGGGGSCPAGGGPIAGMQPDHCMGMFQEVSDCIPTGTGDGGANLDAGMTDFPEPSIGTKDMDDDCKYMVSYINDCVRQGGPGTTFTATLTSLTKNVGSNMAPVTGSTSTYIEAFLNMNHPALGGDNAAEIMPGVYKFGAVKFDAPGKWTVRFHFFGNCSDAPEDAPHSHRAFFINVP